ncbi:helix-turn-helix transcriptional regulator [Gudongella oleilytica]|jgi:transcriptional regulator with XRE-family HTH domain|uniref:helix-turn-helix domain-containing protein n=1 Tax=Gudongella oleilytica TaxID=1582259 RepID=UPI002A363CE7|nr:helix-turn-helix transcriptional regulator [Gudongella oleilytica]MDY0256606.1 helix-turn-helix transcriptional regulator [Gudongella oleilytica]
MAIGERIRFIRTLRGMTQKYLGQSIGFDEKTADVRMAQYEAGTRKPKADLTKSLADALDVSPYALDVPDIDSNIGLMHTFFALEDLRGLRIDKIDGKLCIRLDKTDGNIYNEMLQMFSAWYEQASKFNSGEISKEEYDQWRYRYPELDISQNWVKVPSQELSDSFVKELKDKEVL